MRAAVFSSELAGLTQTKTETFGEWKIMSDTTKPLLRKSRNTFRSAAREEFVHGNATVSEHPGNWPTIMGCITS